jgi:hypothetical protein
MKVFFRIALCAILSTVLYAQAPDTLWTRTYGGDDWDWGYCVQPCIDGGFIIVGGTNSFPEPTNLYLVKTDENGGEMWIKVYGGTNWDYGSSIRQISDKGYIIAGTTWSFGAGNYDFWLLRTDSLGDTLWTRTFGGSNHDEGRSVCQTFAGDYVTAGYTSSFGAGNHDVWMIKVNPMGDTLWTRTFGGSNDDEGWSVIQTIDSGFVIVGYTESFGLNGRNVWLIKTDSSGDTLWTRTYGGGESDCGYSLAQTTDGGYIISGYTQSFGNGSEDIYLIRTDQIGDTLWTSVFGGDNIDEGRSVIQTYGGCYAVAGISGISSFPNFHVMKVDTLGDEIWSLNWGGLGYEDVAFSITQTEDCKYIVCGYTYSYSTQGQADIWLVSLDADETPCVEENHVINTRNAIPIATILGGLLQLPMDRQYKIFDITGRQIHTLDPAPGIYFIEVDGEIRQKVIKIK